jgi:hypothetical protein
MSGTGQFIEFGDQFPFEEQLAAPQYTRDCATQQTGIF